MSNQFQNDQWPILHILSYAYYQHFCDICLSATYFTCLSFIQYWNAIERSYFMEILLLTLVMNGVVILRWRGQTSRSLGTKIQNNIFCTCVWEKCINLYQTNTEMIFCPFYTYCQIHFASMPLSAQCKAPAAIIHHFFFSDNVHSSELSNVMHHCGLQPSSQNTHVLGRWSVALRLFCLCPINLKFLWHSDFE